MDPNRQGTQSPRPGDGSQARAPPESWMQQQQSMMAGQAGQPQKRMDQLSAMGGQPTQVGPISPGDPRVGVVSQSSAAFQGHPGLGPAQPGPFRASTPGMLQRFAAEQQAMQAGAQPGLQAGPQLSPQQSHPGLHPSQPGHQQLPPGLHPSQSGPHPLHPAEPAGMAALGYDGHLQLPMAPEEMDPMAMVAEEAAAPPPPPPPPDLSTLDAADVLGPLVQLMDVASAEHQEGPPLEETFEHFGQTIAEILRLQGEILEACQLQVRDDDAITVDGADVDAHKLDAMTAASSQLFANVAGVSQQMHEMTDRLPPFYTRHSPYFKNIETRAGGRLSFSHTSAPEVAVSRQLVRLQQELLSQYKGSP